MLLLKTKNTKKINLAKVVLGHTHTAGPGSDSNPPSDSSHFIGSRHDSSFSKIDLFTFGPEKSENPNTIPHFDLM